MINLSMIFNNDDLESDDEILCQLSNKAILYGIITIKDGKKYLRDSINRLHDTENAVSWLKMNDLYKMLSKCEHETIDKLGSVAKTDKPLTVILLKKHGTKILSYLEISLNNSLIYLGPSLLAVLEKTFSEEIIKYKEENTLEEKMPDMIYESIMTEFTHFCPVQEVRMH